ATFRLGERPRRIRLWRCGNREFPRHGRVGSARNLGLHHPDHPTQYPKESAMSKTAITSPELAPPVGPFSQAIEVGGFIYFSGQVGRDPATGKVVERGIAAEAER